MHLAPALVACESLPVVNKLVLGELVNGIAEFNGAYGGIIPAVPPRYIVTD